MPRFLMTRRSVLALIAALSALLIAPTAASASVTTLTGTLADGAQYLIEKPSNWNGTLLLYSHGYVVPGKPNPALDVGDAATGGFLLAQGYALAGSSYATTGWAIEQAIPDQVATVGIFRSQVGIPSRTIAWGHSLGGMITAGLLQTHPELFTAALPMCGVVAGGVGVWNQGLDAEFAIKQLLAPTSQLQVVNITNPTTNLNLAETVLFGAQATPQGRARIALAAALGDTPGWFDPTKAEPAATDYAARETNQFEWITQVDGPFLFALRAELEFRAGGNPSWNTGIDYAEQFEKSVNQAEVRALYKQAGLSLDSDLAALAAAPRISAKESALDYLTTNIVFNGKFSGKPVLTMHTTGDGLVLNQDEQAYRDVAQDARDSRLLREIFVHRAGHCTFTPAETVVALKTLEKRINTGKWGDSTDTEALNAQASSLGALNVAPPSFTEFEPTQFMRPFDLGKN